MIMTIDGEIRLKDVPKELMQTLTAQLTIQNPAYTSALRMGLPLYSIPRRIMLYQVRDNELVIPRGLWLQVWRQRPAGTVKRNFTVTLPAVDFPRADIKLRDYQDRVAQGVLEGGIPQGVVVMPCGGGKTETGLYLISRLRQPTLWITHTHDLVQQAADRARERLGLVSGELGIYSAGREEIGTHLTVATVQTLYNRDLEELGRCFGCVVVDECHRVVNNPEQAGMFSAVLAQLPAKYRFGLTASAYRTDGLTDTIYHVLGEKLAEVGQDELNRKGNVVTPRVLPLVTRFEYLPAPGESPVNFTRLQRCLAADTVRTEAIAAYILSELLDGHSCLVLASGLALLEDLNRRLSDAGQKSVMISGKTKAPDRAAALAGMRRGVHKALCATYQLAMVGLDLPIVDRLFLASPIKTPAAVQQSVGRVMRPMPGKKDAIVYDFYDKAVGICKNQFYQRRKVYKGLGCTIEKEIIL